ASPSVLFSSRPTRSRVCNATSGVGERGYVRVYEASWMVRVRVVAPVDCTGLTPVVDAAAAGRAAPAAATWRGTGAPGRRNPEADWRIAADNCASLEMLCEVAVVAAAVCVEISLSTCMLRAIFCASVTCWRELEKMFCTRLAIWVETCSISSSGAATHSVSRGA